MDIQTIAIIGAGTMGNGIAHTVARSGFKVILHDIAESFLDRAVSTIAKNLEREVAKGRVTANDKNAVLSRISAVTQNSALSEADFVIEAVIEDIETKLRVFEGMDRIARPGVILASNTSSLSITKIASKTKRPDKVIGMHFMNPVPVMQLVEVIRGLATSDETTQRVLELSKAVGKTAVEVPDYPGLVANRILRPMINEA